LTSASGWRGRLGAGAFGAGWAAGELVPEAMTGRLLELVAGHVWRRRGDGVAQLEANLRRAAPAATQAQVRELSRMAMSSYFRYWHEVFRLPQWSRGRIVDTVVTANEESLRDTYGPGGAVVALPHMGNWDLAGAWACLTGLPVSTVAERLEPESLFARFVAYRERLGMEVVPLSGGDSPLAAMRRALDRGRVVCLLADRDLSSSGVEGNLLGEPARLPGGPAILSRVSGAPLVALALSYQGPRMRIDFSGPIAVRGGRDGLRLMTQQVADHFTTGIRRTPTDWHMLQRVFSADLSQPPRRQRVR
jgi:phosphatidylinositol dimannoside acyltransferase